MRLICILTGGCRWQDLPSPGRDETGSTWLPASGVHKSPRLLVFQRCVHCADHRAMIVSPFDHESRFSRPRRVVHELDDDEIRAMAAGVAS
jgi:hypothetical protein